MRATPRSGARTGADDGGGRGPPSRPLLEAALAFASVRAERLADNSADSYIEVLKTETFAEYVKSEAACNRTYYADAASDGDDTDGDEDHVESVSPSGVTLHIAVRDLAKQCTVEIVSLTSSCLGKTPLLAAQLARARLLCDWARRAEAHAAGKCVALLLDFQAQQQWQLKLRGGAPARSAAAAAAAAAAPAASDRRESFQYPQVASQTATMPTSAGDDSDVTMEAPRHRFRRDQRYLPRNLPGRTAEEAVGAQPPGNRETATGHRPAAAFGLWPAAGGSFARAAAAAKAAADAAAATAAAGEAKAQDDEPAWKRLRAAEAEAEAAVGPSQQSVESSASSPTEAMLAALKQLERTRFACAACVGRWGELRQLVADAAREEAALAAQLPAAKAAADAHCERLRAALQDPALRAVESEDEDEDGEGGDSSDEDDW